jgi:cytochrome c oxidase subunit 2
LAKHVVAVVALWILFTVAALAVILTFAPFPVAAAKEAVLVDEAFTTLTVMAVPVFTFVIATLLYSLWRFRSHGRPSEDGPPVYYRTPLIVAWFVVTTVLTFVVIVHPGITGLREIRASENKTPDLLVQMRAQTFAWTATYPQQGVFSRRELVLPVDQHVRFDVDSIDVIHSFWIPAFRIKIDAVPGITTRAAAEPIMLGNFDGDPNFRVQCAELCGVGHAVMRMPVRVVTQEEFDVWIAQQSPIR